MTANNNIKTPTMTLPLQLPSSLDLPEKQFIAKSIAAQFKKVTLRDVA